MPINSSFYFGKIEVCYFIFPSATKARIIEFFMLYLCTIESFYCTWFTVWIVAIGFPTFSTLMLFIFSEGYF